MRKKERKPDPYQEAYEREQAAARADGLTQAQAKLEASIDAAHGFEWTYPGLKVFVRDGQVMRPDKPYGQFGMRSLGDLKGAQAGMTGKNSRVGLTVAAVATLGAAGLAALASKSSSAFILFPDGKLHVTELRGNKAIAQAELDVVRFNAEASK